MANKTIHQLSAMNEFDSGDEFAVYDTSANTTGKMTIANVLGTSITGLGTTATTIPGAISELNTGLGTVNTLLGSGDISSIGDGSVTGAISSLNNDLAILNSNGINNMVSDANNAINTGILYGANDQAINTPRTAYWILWVRKFSGSHMTQYALLANATYALLYARSMGSGTWGEWAKVEDTRPVSITNGVVTTATPVVRHKNGIITIEFALQIPARTYTTSNALWTVSRPPSGIIHFIVFVGSSPVVLRLTNSGEIIFNSDTTLSSTTWVIGHVTYPSD